MNSTDSQKQRRCRPARRTYAQSRLCLERLESRRLLAYQLEQTFLPDRLGPLPGADYGASIEVNADYHVISAPDAEQIYVLDSDYELNTIIGNPTGGSIHREFGRVIDLHDHVLAVSAYRSDATARDSGMVFLFDLNSDLPSEPIATIPNPTPAIGDQFGADLAISGDRLIVGAPLDDTFGPNRGAVYVYDLPTDDWNMPSLTIHHPNTNYVQYGEHLELHGNTLAVGYSREAISRIDLYDLASTSPDVPTRSLENPEYQVNDGFGSAMALSDQTLLVGVPRFELSDGTSGVGRGLVYDLTSPSTLPEHVLEHPAPSREDGFGSTVAITEAALLVAAPFAYANGSPTGGAVYVFGRQGSDPTTATASLTGDEVFPTTGLGRSVAAFQEKAYIGVNATNRASPIHVFDVSDPTQPTREPLLADVTSGVDAELGAAVEANDRWLAIGAPHGRTALGIEAGLVRIYDADGQLARTIMNPTPDHGEEFGKRIALEDDYLVVSVPRDMHAFCAVYIYDLSIANPAEPVWTFSQSQSFRTFGEYLDISRDRVVVHSGEGNGELLIYNLSSVDPTVPAQVLSADAFGLVDLGPLAIHDDNLVLSGRDAGTYARRVVVVNLADPAHPLELMDPTPTIADFGTSVTIGNDLVLVSSPRYVADGVDAGAIHLFSLSSPTPSFAVATLVSPEGQEGLRFGESFDFKDGLLLTGVPGYVEEVRTGRAYLYDLNGQTPFRPVATFVNPPRGQSDNFGEAVAIGGSQMFIGAPNDDQVNRNQGAAYRFMPVSQPGFDLNVDGAFDCVDIDALTHAIVQGIHEPMYDLNGDNRVNEADRDLWLAQVGSFTGRIFKEADANLDGTVDASDFNAWNANKFSVTDAWCSGDFNTDGSVDVSDFNVWNATVLQRPSPPRSAPSAPSAPFSAVGQPVEAAVLAMQRVGGGLDSSAVEFREFVSKQAADSTAASPVHALEVRFESATFHFVVDCGRRIFDRGELRGLEEAEEASFAQLNERDWAF